MNLSKIFETQKALDDRIVKEKGLEGQNLLPKKILALQVELGELANEWRGFKFWSENQEAHTKAQRLTGLYSDMEIETFNPLLEEYVDCLHFILSIGNELGEKPRFNFQIMKNETVVDSFLDVMEQAINLDIKATALFDYDILFMKFYELGVIHLGFTWEAIEQAYFEKNKINHARQDGGY